MKNRLFVILSLTLGLLIFITVLLVNQEEGKVALSPIDLTVSETLEVGICGETSIDSITSDLTLEQKIEQLIVPLIGGNQLQEITGFTRNYGGYVIVDTYNRYELEADLTEDLKKLQPTSDIKPLVGVDGEGGVIKRFPWYEITPIQTLSSDAGGNLCTKLNEDIEYMYGLGFNWVLTPVLDVPQSEDDWIYNRAISTDSDVVSAIGKLYVECANANNIVTTPKHFPGHGYTDQDSHYVIPEIHMNYESWEMIARPPYDAVIDADAPMLMSGHLRYSEIDSEISSQSSFWLNDVLRDDLGFEGVIITDDLGMLAPDDLESCVELIQKSLDAGNDMVIVPLSPACDIDAAVGMIETTYEIDLKVKRVLKLKRDYLCE